MEIALSKSFALSSPFTLLPSLPESFCDHVVSDPTFTFDRTPFLDRLERLIPLIHNLLRPGGFFCFFYPDARQFADLEKLLRDIGFDVQPWPLIWNMIRGPVRNKFPRQEFPQSYEQIIVARKPREDGPARLAICQNGSIYTTSRHNFRMNFPHAFSKPLEIWRWFYYAISIEQQVIFDPYAGVGSSLISALHYRRHAMGCVEDEQTYNLLLENMQTYHRKIAPRESGVISFT